MVAITSTGTQQQVTTTTNTTTNNNASGNCYCLKITNNNLLSEEDQIREIKTFNSRGSELINLESNYNLNEKDILIRKKLQLYNIAGNKDFQGKFQLIMGIEEFMYYVKCEMCLMSTKKVLHSRKSLKDIWKELQNKSSMNIKGKEINLCILHQDLNNNLFIYKLNKNYKPQSNKKSGANKTNVNSGDDLQKQEKKRKRKKDSSEEITLLPTLNEKKKKKSISEMEEEQQQQVEEQLNHNNQQQQEEEEEQLDDNNDNNNSPLDSEETQSFPNTEINIESLPQDQEQQRFKDDETVLFDNDCTEYFDFNLIENNIDSNCKTEVDLLKEQVARLTEEKAIIQQNYDILLNHFRMHVFQGSQLVFRVDPSLQHLFQ